MKKKLQLNLCTKDLIKQKMDKQEIINSIQGMSRSEALATYPKFTHENITRKEFKKTVFENTTRIDPFQHNIERVPIPKHVGKKKQALIDKEYAIFLDEQQERISNDN